MPRQSQTSKETTPTPDELYARIFDQLYDAVSGFFRRRGFDADESGDLTQETFLRVYRGMREYRREASTKTWVFSIAANLYRNELRSRQAAKRDAIERSLEEMLEQGEPIFVRRTPAGTPLAEALDAERRREVRSAATTLPPRMRRCVFLWLDHQLSYGEIAVVLQVSPETVKAQFFQARRKLGPLLEHLPA